MCILSSSKIQYISMWNQPSLSLFMINIYIETSLHQCCKRINDPTYYDLTVFLKKMTRTWWQLMVTNHLIRYMQKVRSACPESVTYHTSILLLDLQVWTTGFPDQWSGKPVVHTRRCCYNGVIVLQNIHKGDPIACLLGCGVFCVSKFLFIYYFSHCSVVNNIM